MDNAGSIDPYLLQWLAGTLGRELETPADLDRVVRLEANDFHWGTPTYPDWLIPVPGDWSLIGAMPNLEKLEFPNIPDAGLMYHVSTRTTTRFYWAGVKSYSFLLKCGGLKYLDLSQTSFYESWYLENLSALEYLMLPPAELPDFSFLKRCKNLIALDVSKTNFRDCSVLRSLSALQTVELPPRKNLVHSEVLDTLAANASAAEPEPERAGPAPYYLSKKKARLGENGFYAQIIVVNGRRYCGTAITKELVQKLVGDIKRGNVRALTVSADIDLESVLFTAEIKDGWAALTLQDFEEDVCYQPRNAAYEGIEESAPPKMGGQSPVPKSRAVEDLTLAAECVRRYIKSGKLSAQVTWSKED